VKLLFLGPLWEGSTALQRARAFASVEGGTVVQLDSEERVGKASLADRVRHRLRLPADKFRVNQRLLEAVARERPELVVIDSTRLVTRRTLRRLRAEHRCTVSFYSPDDVSQRHNSSRQLESCDREWDVFFTTKSFNVPELTARGIKQPVLVGKSFDAAIHRPMTRAEVGDEYERFDAVFTGTCEGERLESINSLARAGIGVVVYGNGYKRTDLHATIEVRAAAYAVEYTRTLHTGKVGLCFLRKMNRDRVTQRSVELPASGRAMVAEKTEEHDELFEDGTEYLGFSDDRQLLRQVRLLVSDEPRRVALAAKARQRCLDSGYSSLDRARAMWRALASAHAARARTISA
jgi:hypothetical protein